MEPTTSTAPDPEATTLVVYTTKRRLVTNGASGSSSVQWRPHYSLSLGTETVDGDLGIVCYYDDSDISGLTVEVDTMPVVLQKLQCDSNNAERSYTFIISLEGTRDTELCFHGTLEDHEGEWEWEGRYAGTRTLSRGRQARETYGPDGRSSLQELLSYPSLYAQRTHPAQQEASHIFGRILLASIPHDVKKALQLNFHPLDPEEERIRSLSRSFLPWAAVVALFKHWHQSESVDQRQRDRIDIHRCEQFYSACAAYRTPIFGVDPVGELGEDDNVEEQYHKVTLECYRLGYRRKVSWLQSFLDHPAYWYERLADYLISPAHLNRLKMRVAVRDPQIEPDARDWYNKLVLLKDAAEDNIGDAPTMEDVAYALNKILPKPSTDNNPVDNTYIARLEELFTLIDDLRFDSEEHNQLTEHLAMRQNVAWGGVRRALMQLIQDYRLTCARDPTITEVINAFCCNTGSIISNAPSVDSSRWLGLPPMAASILVGNAMIIILSTLLTDKSRLPLSEKITLFLTLVPATMKSTWESVKEIGAYITEFLPPHLGRLLSSKAMTVINGASELWSKVGITVSYVVGVILAGICAWNAFNRFHKMWKDGETVDKLGAGWDVLLSASFSAVTIYRSVAVKSGASASVLAWCGALSGGIVITAAISSLVFAAVKWCPRRDPIAAFITNYGGRYGLLRQSGR